MRNVVIFSSEDIADLFRDTPVAIHDKNGIETVFVSERGYKTMMRSCFDILGIRFCQYD